MRELSLHILDLIENSIRAGASIVSVSIVENTQKDCLDISVEDNGPGLNVCTEISTDPFYTTKKGKRIGLGLSLLRAAAEQACGDVVFYRSRFGGLAVKATMQLSHIDRMPLGDFIGTISDVICTNPMLDMRCSYHVNGREYNLRTLDMAEELSLGERTGLTLAELVSKKMKSALDKLGTTA